MAVARLKYQLKTAYPELLIRVVLTSRRNQEGPLIGFWRIPCIFGTDMALCEFNMLGDNKDEASIPRAGRGEGLISNCSMA